MEATQTSPQVAGDQHYSIAAHQLLAEKRTGTDVIDNLVGQGLDPESAQDVLANLQAQIEQAKKSSAQKDMLYGALWCVGGIVATMASIGFIFWGAIIFGAIQFFKGLAAYVD